MHHHYYAAPLGACALLLGGCSSDTQSDQDAAVVYGALDTHVFLFDQNLVGLPVGAQDVTADCPLGGSAHIVGETADSGTSIDLTYDMAGCRNSGTNYRLTFTGPVHVAGTFRSTGYKALSSNADSLGVVGTVEAGGSTEDVEETCVLAVTDRGEDGQPSTVSGEWCGRAVEF